MLTRPKAGYAIAVGPDGTVEYDTITCSHCNKAVVVRTSDIKFEGDLGYGRCLQCDHDICGPCEEKSRVRGCEPFMKKIELMEARCRFLSSIE